MLDTSGRRYFCIWIQKSPNLCGRGFNTFVSVDDNCSTMHAACNLAKLYCDFPTDCCNCFCIDDIIFFVFQPIPYTADNLLGSFFKLQDGSMLVGGKEAISCGIDPKTGKVLKVDLSCFTQFISPTELFQNINTYNKLLY